MNPTMTKENFRYTSAPERRDRLVQFITEQGYCTITELSKAFAVSEMTIRRDVLRLTEQGKVRGFRGGVGSLSKQDMEGSDYHLRDVKMADAKRAIALRAVEMIGTGSVVAIDAGTTTRQVADLLPGERGVTVVTHSFPVVSSLIGRGGTEVMCLGGLLHPESLSFDGPATLSAISNLQVETLFLAASGIGERGAFCGNGFDAITKRALIEVAEHVVLLTDSSKFYASAMVKICGWDAIDRVVIDDGITDEHRLMLQQQDIDVVTVTTAPHELTSGAAS
ncbi:DeoR family transcriptional regulator, aga operon transcriptional repressor/DeoR family transcriptional regulator, fructose operon transcriptional repressor [Nonomuraea jiangxiensis]|uniref:DeoR family transcriptional regulator, aga operon transcriptional repressor/DeoR family transcriptional regulator, fructose operon transcriptional repressor n=2 Tax=Nonomuraea jiangxiensis TaxID=633440 RepID=A0A1G9FCI6_9ACTN|nr:DeoR family transcriptional regulator, aga operon transcriptional repressor/DeoR family transcriptional regulator, fructose operon transcriptional repressor [Nonomuraea jiangxiensis]